MTIPILTASPVLQVSGLRFGYPGQPRLFDGLGFDLPAGLTRLDADIGKTTLVRLLAGALPAEQGAFTLQGQPWQPAAGAAQVCWLDPRDAAWDALTPDQVLAAAAQGRVEGLDAAAWECHLRAFDLVEHRHKTMHMLSTGGRRKVTLAASLALDVPLTLLDEPVGGLDKASIDALVAALAQPAAQRRAWMITAAWGLEDRLPWAAVLTLDDAGGGELR